MKSRNRIIGFCALLSCALLPEAQGAPESALPGFNTADGDHALVSNATGVGNAAFGWYSLFANTDGSFNTGVGAGTLALNIGNQNTGEGIQNTAVGAAALLLNSKGQGNTAVGASALLSNDSTASGAADFNSAFGFAALQNNTDGSNDTAVGSGALQNNTTGAFNTAVGNRALVNNATGQFNIALGFESGINQDTGSNNIYISDVGASGESNVIAIGARPGTYTTTLIGGIFGAAVTGSAVFIDSSGKLGTVPSSSRFKEQIEPMDKASEALYSLKPVTFRYKKEMDPSGKLQFGLVAEDVAKVNPDLVVRDRDGKTYSVRYDQVYAMLLNEFLKEHRKVEEQAVAIAELKREIERLAAKDQERAAQIQRVSAQLDLATARPQTVANK